MEPQEPFQKVLSAADRALGLVPERDEKAFFALVEAGLQLLSDELTASVGSNDESGLLLPVDYYIDDRWESGLILTLQDRAVVAWMTGRLRAETNRREFRYAEIGEVGAAMSDRATWRQPEQWTVQMDGGRERLRIFRYANGPHLPKLLAGVLTGGITFESDQNSAASAEAPPDLVEWNTNSSTPTAAQASSSKPPDPPHRPSKSSDRSTDPERSGANSQRPRVALMLVPVLLVASMAVLWGLLVRDGGDEAEPSATNEVEAQDSVTANDGGVAVTVNGSEISQEVVDSEINDLVDFAREDRGGEFASAVFGEGGDGQDTVTSAFVAQVLQERVVSVIINDEFTERGLEITQEDRDAAEDQFASQLALAPEADPAADPATPPPTTDPAAGQAVFDGFSQEFQDFEIEFNAQALVLSEVLAAEQAEVVDVTAEDVRAYYDEHPEEFTQNCASHILVDDEATAQDLYDQIQAGADFATLASENSTDTGSAASGGDLGCQPVGTFVPEFEAAMDEAETDEVTEPVQTEFGYHLILVSQGGLEDFNDVEAQIRTQLETPSEDALDTFITDALENADVEVNPRYGSWDADTQAVVPPDGNASPTTTAGGAPGG